MKKLILPVVAIAALSLSSCGGASSDLENALSDLENIGDKLENVDVEEVVEIAEEELNPFSYEYVSEDGGYVINFGKEPTVTSQDVPTEAGNISMTMAMDEKSFNEAFMISHNDYPSALVEMSEPYVLLNGAVDGATASQGMTIEQERREEEFQGLPSVYYKGGTPAGMEAIYRVVLKNNRMYQVIALLNGGKISAANEEAFFGSFKINE